MRNLVLVALVLQLLLTLTEAKEEYQFGDIISFKRNCMYVGPSYKHFAVYVGDMDFPGKQAGQDIFHRPGPKKVTGDCGFGVLEKEKGKRAKDNFLDEYFPGQMGTAAHRAQMKERINHWKSPENCGTYNLRKNNCEHLATHVRYNYTISLQQGTAAGRLCKIGSRFLGCGRIDKMLKDMEENERRREECNNKSSSSAMKPPEENETNREESNNKSSSFAMKLLLICVALFVCASLFMMGYILFRKRSRGSTSRVNYVRYP